MYKHATEATTELPNCSNYINASRAEENITMATYLRKLEAIIVSTDSKERVWFIRADKEMSCADNKHVHKLEGKSVDNARINDRFDKLFL